MVKQALPKNSQIQPYLPLNTDYISLFKTGLWGLGIPSWLFAIGDRGLAALGDGSLSAPEISQVFVASLLFIFWLYLKPEGPVPSPDAPDAGYSCPQEATWRSLQAQLLDLGDYHIISQEYTLPFPYLCQIYHLLNLKHLENVHSFSLNNLKVVGVSYFQATGIGGKLTFQTQLDSPVNALRIWRQEAVEVELTLHSSHTVELRVPVYGGKKVIVMFNVFPLGEDKHKFLVDIYSDLDWPRPLLQLLFHCASCLTLYEDLPYLQRLTQRNLSRLLTSRRISSHETMRLYNRFVDLYGGTFSQPSSPIS
ncbi:MAG: hypothetical protein HC890_00540 [Chloroflexaceae bacterium]|nr:hypothetical protein [Chloroflexaceae bacterium]